jgi:hypothetical protein
MLLELKEHVLIELEKTGEIKEDPFDFLMSKDVINFVYNLLLKELQISYIGFFCFDKLLDDLLTVGKAFESNAVGLLMLLNDPI